MHEPNTVTGYADVDQVVLWFLREVQALLGAEFVALYVCGSLALGDFDPNTSDIDLVIVTEARLAPATIAALRTMHARFDQQASHWSGRIEAVYADRAALRTFPPGEHTYPQVEKERVLFEELLEMGWIFQCWTLRQHGIALAGPNPRELIPPLDLDEMRRAAAPIALMWQRAAREDRSWLEWLRERQNQAFVVLTLCRLLYTLDLGEVASKPTAARWAQQSLDEQRATLIGRALAYQHAAGEIETWEEQQTLALIDDVVLRFGERLSTSA